MNSFSWRSLTSHAGSEFLTWLHESTQDVLEVIRGIGRFVVVKIPHLCRDLFSLFEEWAIFACRAAYHLSRFLGVFVGWLCILFAPLVIYPGVFTTLWLLIALSGSVWTLKQRNRKRTLTTAAEKEHDDARA